MSTAYTNNMEQLATYWAPGVPDGFGKLSFAAVAPVVIKCRWQDVAVLFRDAQAREVMSTAIVYPDRTLALRGFLALGDVGAVTGSDPRTFLGSREVRQIGASPSLRADEQLNKAWL